MTPSQRIADLAMARVQAGAEVIYDDEGRYVVATEAGSVHFGAFTAYLNGRVVLEAIQGHANYYAMMRDGYLTQQLPAERVLQ